MTGYCCTVYRLLYCTEKTVFKIHQSNADCRKPFSTTPHDHTTWISFCTLQCSSFIILSLASCKRFGLSPSSMHPRLLHMCIPTFLACLTILSSLSYPTNVSSSHSYTPGDTISSFELPTFGTASTFTFMEPPARPVLFLHINEASGMSMAMWQTQASVDEILTHSSSSITPDIVFLCTISNTASSFSALMHSVMAVFESRIVALDVQQRWRHRLHFVSKPLSELSNPFLRDLTTHWTSSVPRVRYDTATAVSSPLPSSSLSS